MVNNVYLCIGLFVLMVIKLSHTMLKGSKVMIKDYLLIGSLFIAAIIVFIHIFFNFSTNTLDFKVAEDLIKIEMHDDESDDIFESLENIEESLESIT